MLLRLPQQLANRVSDMLSNSPGKMLDRVKFRMTDEKMGKLTFTDEQERQTIYNAKLVELPTHIESHKLFHGRYAFKSADIHQMLVIEFLLEPIHLSVGSFDRAHACYQ